MSGASIETALEFWTSSLRDVKVRIGSLFKLRADGVSAVLFLASISATFHMDASGEVL